MQIKDAVVSLGGLAVVLQVQDGALKRIQEEIEGAVGQVVAISYEIPEMLMASNSLCSNSSLTLALNTSCAGRWLPADDPRVQALLYSEGLADA
jgi:hypothetical protein